MSCLIAIFIKLLSFLYKKILAYDNMYVCGCELLNQKAGFHEIWFQLILPRNYKFSAINILENAWGVLQLQIMNKLYIKQPIRTWFLTRNPNMKHIVAWRLKPVVDRPLLINGYASSSGFIGNNCKYTQRPTSEHWKHIGGSFPRSGYNRPLLRKSLYE
jgi:hypothetical protein